MDGTIPHFTDRDAFIAHYGIPGMRWGRRKGSSKTSEHDDTPNSDDFDTVRKHLSKPVRTLSNAELRQIQDRVNLERKYSEIKKANLPSTKVANTVKGILAVAGTVSAIIALGNSPAGKAVKGLIENRKAMSVAGKVAGEALGKAMGG